MKRPPVFVPEQFQGEIEKLSKACLMDMVWDLARRNAGRYTDDATMKEVRNTAEIVNLYRNRWYRCEDCGIIRHIRDLTSGCPLCGETMVPL
jgi:hypothetical protein